MVGPDNGGGTRDTRSTYESVIAVLLYAGNSHQHPLTRALRIGMGAELR